MDFPIHRGEGVVKKTTDDHPSRPRRVKDVEIVRLVIGIKGGDERINDRFANTVADGENEHGPEQTLVGGVFAAGGEEGWSGES